MMLHKQIKSCQFYLLLLLFFWGASAFNKKTDTNHKRQPRVVVRHKKPVVKNQITENVTKSCPTFDNVRVYKIVKKGGCCFLEKVTSTPFDTNIKALEWCSNNLGTFLLAGADPGSNDNNDYQIALYQAAFCGTGFVAPCQR